MNTLVELLRYRAASQPDQVAYTFLVDGESAEVSLTYQRLHQRAGAIATDLHGISTPGDRALLLYPPGLDYITAFFGCLCAGIVAVPAYLPRPNRPLSTLESIAADAQITLVLTTTELYSTLKNRLTSISPFNTCHWLTTNLRDAATQRQNPELWFAPDISPQTLAFLQYTSGSTATPKGVMISHQNVLHNLATISQCFETTPKSRGVIWLPPYHDMGLIGGVLQPLYGGYPVTLMSPLMFLQSPLRWLKAISHDRATISGGPNFAYDFCIQRVTPEQRATLDLSSWDVAFNGAEPICPQVLEKFATTFQSCGFRSTAFYPCYGLAESTLMVSGGRRNFEPLVKAFPQSALTLSQVNRNQNSKEVDQGDRFQYLVSCGDVPSQQKLIIVDPHTQQPCTDGKVGEIWLSGSSVAQGYWNRPQETEQTFKAELAGSTLAGSTRGSFLRTGDLGLIEQGQLFVTGRIKDLMIINGRNHYPQDLERTVENHIEAIRPHNSVAFSITVEGKEKVVIVAELERQDWQRWKKTMNNIEHECNHSQSHQSLDFQKLVQDICKVIAKRHDLQTETVVLTKPGTLPKTSSGKLQRYLCRERFLAGNLQGI